MGKRIEKNPKSARTLPSSPSHSFSSSSSSEFEFTISISPRKSSTTLCPADELFYKGQLLPLHLSPRISMVRTLLLASSSTSSSSDSNTTASRDSTESSASNDSHSSFNSELALLAESCESSPRPSSATEDEECKRPLNNSNPQNQIHNLNTQIKKSKYFSLSRFSSVFKKEAKNNRDPENVSGSSVKRMSFTAKEVITKYLKKVKPLYEKLSQKQQQKMGGLMAESKDKGHTTINSTLSLPLKTERSAKETELSVKNSRKENNGGGGISHSFSGNLRYPRRRSCISSCPSSIRSSPSHSGVLCRPGFTGKGGGGGGSVYSAETSSMEELQSAIQGAIAHCKNSMIQNKAMVSNEI